MVQKEGHDLKIKLNKDKFNFLLCTKGINMDELCRKANITKRTLYNSFNTGVTIKTIQRIASACNVDYETFILLSDCSVLEQK